MKWEYIKYKKMIKNYFKKLLVFSLFLSITFVVSQTKDQIKEIKKANNTEQLKKLQN